MEGGKWNQSQQTISIVTSSMYISSKELWIPIQVFKFWDFQNWYFFANLRIDSEIEVGIPIYKFLF